VIALFAETRVVDRGAVVDGEGRVLIEFRLLGSLEVWRDGSRVELGGRKQRAVLTALLVRAGRVVSLDQLIDDLWPGAPPARAAATVQVFVSNLRRVLSRPCRAARRSGAAQRAEPGSRTFLGLPVGAPR
jgi:DNA-binding response OmpR family regulator